MSHPFDGRPIRRIEIGPIPASERSDPPSGTIPIKTPDITASPEAIWRAVVDFSNGSAPPVEPAATPPAAAAEDEIDWGGISWGSDPNDFLY